MKSFLIAAVAMAAVAASASAQTPPAGPPAAGPAAPGAPGGFGPGGPGGPGGGRGGFAPAPFDPANPIAGCTRCHMEGRPAPSLKGVYGRKIASLDGVMYSDALKAKAGVWDEKSLDPFLKDSQTDTPGTRMRQMVPDDQRKIIIDYLKSYK